MKENYVVFLEIENEYIGYAACIKFIKDVINGGAISLSQNNSISISFYEYRMNTVTPNKLEEPIDGASMSSSITSIKNIEMIKNQIICNPNLHFHIRIHFPEDSIKINNMHYISMLLLSNKSLVEQNRFSVFLVPRSGSSYPFSQNGSTDIELYEYASTYLRTLIGSGNKGVIYGVSKPATLDDANIVKALDFKCTKSNEDYFPLIVLNRVKNENVNEIEKYINAPKVGKNKGAEKLDTKSLNHYTILFRNDIVVSYFSQAMKMNHSYRFGYANNESPEMSISDYVFETSINCLQSKFEKNNIELKALHDNKELRESYQCFNELLKKSSIFSFAIFSFLFSLPKELSDNNIAELINHYGELSLDLSDAFNQIIQNSLLHATNHLCGITLYKDSYSSDDSNKKFRIIISDLSDKTIIETFTENLTNESILVNDLMRVEKLKRKIGQLKDDISSINNLVLLNSEKIKLKYFFNDFNNDDNSVISLWKEYRKIDSSAHIGMAIFSKILNRCGASFTIISNSSFNFNPKNIYTNINNSKNKKLNTIIPGTEFNIIVPIELKNEQNLNGISQLNYKNFSDNYDSYAHFLDYESYDITIEESQRNDLKELFRSANKILGGKLDKFTQQIIWTYFWLDILTSKNQVPKKPIVIVDFSKIEFRKNYLEEGVHRREVLIKGLINALGMYSSDGINHYIAITNLNKMMIKAFKDIMISLSIKRFPNNLQLFIASDISKANMVQLHLSGSSYGLSLQNSYVISMSNGVNSISDKEYHIISDLIAPFDCESDNKEKVFLAPFSSFINVNKDTEKCTTNMFFENMRLTAEKDMTNGVGYKINHSHTRLGNKIHIDAFYEMSYLFYRTIIANRVAFEVIRSLSDSKIDIINDNILFYGYASYSQAILMSIVNMLRAYRERFKSKRKADYAIYQYNLQSESNSEGIQVYLNNKKDTDCEFKVVQIVPISSTLTTFEKMWAKFNYTYNKNNRFTLSHNHTVMWIRDDIKTKQAEIESNMNSSVDINIEKEYFDEPENGTVHAYFNKVCSCNIIRYIIEGHSYWERPDKCKKCYPDKLINEIPLVETDPTSTVPSQQIYLKIDDDIKYSLDEDNISRISYLRGFVHYKHVKRGKNHFQYYIDTHGYFSEVEYQVKEWLKKLSDNLSVKQDTPYLNIIFSPEHNTNVGFSQYVNAYFFNGNAEIISINEDKEFRSNFICENASLKNIIANLFENFYNDNALKPVKFYFVDDNIITGSTFHKCNSLLLSIIPQDYQEMYATNVFEECFFLIDRLSDSSKKVYVYPTSKFHSFCHINVSNTRKQGDSCLGCKMLLEARKLSRISATHYSAEYWSKKIVDYKAESFEKVEEKDDLRSYYMIMLSHILNGVFVGNSLQNEDKYYFMIKTIFKYFAGVKCNENDEDEQEIYSVLNEYISICIPSTSNIADKRLLIECLIKILTRPFFTFNQAIKKQILRIMIIFSEMILNNDCIDDMDCARFIDPIYKLYDDSHNKLEFIISVVFRALVDLHSTYIIRRKTISSALMFCSRIVDEQTIDNNMDINQSLYNFWMRYSVYIQKVINCSSDETRSLWFERLLLCGNETGDYCKKTTTGMFYDIINEGEPYINQSLRTIFFAFCNEVFINNGHIIYQGIKQIANNENANNNISNSYFLNRWRKYREIDYCSLSVDKNGAQSNFEHTYLSEVSFCNYMDNFSFNEDGINTSKDSNVIRTRYNNLIECINRMILEKYGSFIENNIDIAIFTGFGMNEEDIQQLHNLELIAIHIDNDGNRREAEIKYEIKKRMLEVLLDSFTSKNLKEYGYYIYPSDTKPEQLSKKGTELNNNMNCWDNSDGVNYFILRFAVTDNMIKADNELRKIVPVYMYIRISATSNVNEKRLLYLILREILTYRYSIIKNLIADFTSDVLQRYAHSFGTETILQTEKEISHSPINDDLQQLALLDSEGFKTCSELTLETLLKWMLVRNYCNNMTARLYNRVMYNINNNLKKIITDRESSKYRKALKLYVQQNKCDGNSIPLKSIDDLLPQKHMKSNDMMEDSKIYVREIFKLFGDIIVFKIDNSLANKRIVSQKIHGESYTYNYTYTVNIIIRICLDALRFCKGAGAENNNYKQRIINCYEYQEKSKLRFKYPELLKPYDGCACEVSFGYEKSNNEHFDWLIIKNRIDVSGSNITDITKKLSDPLDFLDGHMSLLAEKEYLSKLFDFKTEGYIIENMFEIENGYFETRLPLIEKEE